MQQSLNYEMKSNDVQVRFSAEDNGIQFEVDDGMGHTGVLLSVGEANILRHWLGEVIDIVHNNELSKKFGDNEDEVN